MVESSWRKMVAVCGVNQLFGNGDCCAEFLFHEVSHFCEVEFVDFNKGGQFLATWSSFWSTAQKWFSCKAMMSMRWSTRLLLLTICVSRCEIFAELKVESVRAAADIPSATKSRKHLSLVMKCV
jgi:hypothetical protein